MSSATSWQATPSNRPSVTVCTLSMIIIGILMVFAGGLMTYIYFTEITPPNYDAYYQRYVGSSFPRIVGILILLAGLTLFWGASIFLVYSNWRKTNSGPADQRRYYFEAGSGPPSGRQTGALGAASQHADEANLGPTYIKESYVA